ncbi:hypothetical protein SAMN05216601_102152 [Ectopseudomonas composti]|uniref:Uncharacterized protein n=2 Tax=Ectopseudomonas composti TaxID=658457 RepID=A0A1I5K5K9_9GAMM|nr:hypothetical protein SAMN05216601_102152 [Pseudomonas composti]
MRMVRHILWLDCMAAAVAGVVVLLFAPWLNDWYSLPRELLSFIGAVNIAYACYSFSLAVRVRRSETLIKLLALANGFWALVCLGIAATFAPVITLPGLCHVLGEAAFVGGLGMLEWKWRRQLRVAGERGTSIPSLVDQ